jgi:hypothetical protein
MTAVILLFKSQAVAFVLFLNTAFGLVLCLHSSDRSDPFHYSRIFTLFMIPNDHELRQR